MLLAVGVMWLTTYLCKREWCYGDPANKYKEEKSQVTDRYDASYQPHNFIADEDEDDDDDADVDHAGAKGTRAEMQTSRQRRSRNERHRAVSVHRVHPSSHKHVYGRHNMFARSQSTGIIKMERARKRARRRWAGVALIITLIGGAFVFSTV
jgi:hypothetical protein